MADDMPKDPIYFKVELTQPVETYADVEFSVRWSKSVGWHWSCKSSRINVTLVQSNALGSYGSDRMVDSKPDCSSGSITDTSGMDSARYAPLDKPKEHAPNCTCGMGIGAQPNAHHPDCNSFVPSYGRYGSVAPAYQAPKPVEVLANPSSVPNGKEADVSEEHRKRIEAFDSMLNAFRAYLGYPQSILQMGNSCPRCGADHGPIKANSSTSLYSLVLTLEPGISTNLAYVCSSCYSVVFA